MMDPFFILLIVLTAAGAIFMLYNIFFSGADTGKIKKQEDQAVDEEKKKLHERIDTLHADLASAKAELEDKHKQARGEGSLIEQLKQENQELVKQKNMFQGKIADVSEELIRLRVQSDELNANADFSPAPDNLTPQLPRKDDQIQALNAKLKEEKEAMLKKEEFMHKKIQDSENEVNRIRQDLEAKEAEIGSYEARISELSEQTKSLAPMEELKQKVQDYEQQVREMTDKNRELAEKLKERNQGIEDREEKPETRVQPPGASLAKGGKTEERGEKREERRKRKEDRRQSKAENRAPAEERRKRKEDRRRGLETGNQSTGNMAGKSEDKGEKREDQNAPPATGVMLELNHRQEEILNYLKDNKKITRREYADRFNISIATASRDLKELQDKDLIDSFGPDGPGRCFVLVRPKTKPAKGWSASGGDQRPNQPEAGPPLAETED